jgi:hypothetical protein
MMRFDSRYAALRWILEHADEDRIGTVGYVYYLPTIAGFQNQPLTYDVLVNAPPRVVASTPSTWCATTPAPRKPG